MFEEVFYLAAQHDRLSEVTKLYSPPFRTLAHGDEELREAVGRFPSYFARAAFSRGGVGLLTNTGPLAGHLSLDDCHPTEVNPWLVQEFVGGPMHCTYSGLHGGKG